MVKMIARVFPRVTRATPVDSLAFYGEPPLFIDGITQVHISVAFTYDLPRAEYLARAWSRIAPVSIGGPATGMAGGDFVPGMYLKKGYVITSRGCDNRCPHCFVWQREGNVRELPVTNGWNVLDDNLLACSPEHIREVFAMLDRQKHAAEFTGGLEAAKLKRWHVEAMCNLKRKPEQMFFAYDDAEDWDPLVVAVEMLREAGFGLTKKGTFNHDLRCYVLIGYRGDTFDAAEKRLQQVRELGFFEMAMLYRGDDGKVDREWRRFQRLHANPVIMAAPAPVESDEQVCLGF